NEQRGVDATTLASYKADILSARTQLNAALSSVSAKEQAIATQKAANEANITSAQKELDLKKAGASTDAIAYQEAQTAQALANVSYARSQLSKTLISAPFDGTVTKIPYQEGDIVQPQGIAVSLIGTGTYQIET